MAGTVERRAWPRVTTGKCSDMARGNSGQDGSRRLWMCQPAALIETESRLLPGMRVELRWASRLHCTT
jgi:hypothetical protein